MNFIIFIIFITCFVSHIHGYNYDAGNIGHNPYMDDKTRSSFKRRNILGQNLDKNGKTKHIPLYSRYNNNKRYDNFYEDFKRHSLEMDKSFPLKDEELMFHGTDEKNIASILENDFALINKAAHGTAYGSGIYFTNQLSLACSYSHDQKIKHILVCNVHIGKIISGVSHQTNLPIGYHTAVDNLHNPHQFIKKKNNQYTFIGLLKIHMSSGSKLIRGNLSRFNSTLRVNNHTFHTDIQILFLKNANVIPTGVDFKKYTEDLLTKAFDNKDKTNVQTHFVKLAPAKVKLHTSISCNLNNIYVLGYYNTGIDDINSKVTREFIIIRIDKIEKNTKIITY